MVDDADAIRIDFDRPDPDLTYRNYLQTCRRLGIEPVPREHADKLIAEWSEAIAAGLAPPTQHTIGMADRGR